jgi:membrane protease YdiL (CAAX protease family)
LRRDYPEPFIALLAFVLGIWLWDHYFGANQGYAPDTEAVALVKIDRDLRLADAMRDDPPWLKFLAGVEDPVVARGNALVVFEKLLAEKAITAPGIEAYAIVKSTQEGLPMRAVLGQFLDGQMIPDFHETSRKLASHRGTWWNAGLMATWEDHVRPGEHWRQAYGEDNLRLRTRAVVTSSLVWLLGAAGLFFVPSALRCMKQGLSANSKGYAKAWPLPLGLVIFLVAILAWIGFNMTLDLGLATLPGLHPAMALLLDSAARVLPALIALALLFRRPGHALKVMGVGSSVAWREIFGMFSLLMIVDQVLRWGLNAGSSTDPGGGLSLGEAGWWGLAFAMVSACLLAPVAEETLYRGVLFRSCRNRLGVIPAALLSSVIFAVLHFYDGYGLASVGVFGFSCALLYSGTGSLSTVIALHMLYNAAIKIPEWIVYHAPLG